MIWTVILKDGGNFVIHGSSYDRNTEVRKCLKARCLSDTSVAGIVPGDHPVETLGITMSTKELSSQIKAALAAPEFDDFDIADKIMEKIGKLSNDPVDW